MSNIKWRRLLNGILLIAFTAALQAQSGKGTISGRALDSSGAVLQGAHIGLQPGNISAVSDSQGEFSFANLTPGAYTLKVSYVGLKVFESTVTLEGGKVVRIDAKLEVASRNESIIVTADRVHGEAEAINRVRTSENIVQVVTAEVITSLPNANMADAIGRLPSVTLERDEGEGKYIQVRGTEPRLTNVTINGATIPSPEGGVRQIKLDAVASDLVESVEVNKTQSASQDADGIGGSVNFVTKRAGDSPTLIITGLGGYTPIQGGRPVGQFGATAGRRFGADKKLGILGGVTYDFNGRGIDDIETGWAVTNGAAAYSSLQTREYMYYRSRYGFTGSADYKFSNSSSIHMDAMWSNFKDYGDKWYYGYSQAKAPTFYTSSRRPVFGVGSSSIGGNHTFKSASLIWNFSASYSRMLAAAGNPKFDFGWCGSNCGLVKTISYNVDATDPYRPQFNPTNIPAAALQDPKNYFLIDGQTSDGTAFGLNLQGGADYAQYYKLGTHLGTFQLGFKIRNSHKAQNAIQAVYDTAGISTSVAYGPAYNMTNFLGTFSNPDYYDGSYNLGPVTDFDKITSNGLPLLVLNQAKTLTNSAANNYNLIERVTAGYLMNTLDLTRRFHLQTGLRFEGTTLHVLGNLVRTDAKGNVTGPFPLTTDSSYLEVLPSVQAKYSLTGDAAIRAVYSRGISRPDPLQLVPYITQTDTTTSGSIKIGNPNLHPEHANNWDLLFEYYLKPMGMIQAGFFYKDLSGPMISLRSTVLPGQYPQDQYAGYLQTQVVNGGHARIDGIELGYQQRLSFLPGFLRGLGIAANYSYTDSGASVAYTDTSTKPASILSRPLPLQRQAPHSWNISPTFDAGRFSLRMGVQYNSRYIFQYANIDPRLTGISGALGPGGDDYVNAHTQVDAQGAIRLYHGLKFIAYGLNLTNEPFGHYAGDPQYMLQREYYKATYAFGLKYDFGLDRK